MSRPDEESSTTVTTEGPLKWMAPEQMHRNEYSAKSDVWVLAVVFFECVAREPPFKDKSSTQAAHLVMKEGSLAVDKASPVLASVMRSCWAFEAAARPTANEIVATLRNAWGLRGDRVEDASN